jgi:hypothetical protein
MPGLASWEFPSQSYYIPYFLLDFCFIQSWLAFWLHLATARLDPQRPSRAATAAPRTAREVSQAVAANEVSGLERLDRFSRLIHHLIGVSAVASRQSMQPSHCLRLSHSDKHD